MNRALTWTEEAVADFEASIHPPVQCPWAGCAACLPSVAEMHVLAATDRDAELRLEAWYEAREAGR